MLEINWDKNSYTFDPTQIPSVIYGDQSIEDNFPSDYSYTGAWGSEPERVPFQILVVYEDKAYVSLEESDAFRIDLPENQDPFTQANLLRSEENQIQDLIFRIKSSKHILCREPLANRLLALFNDAKEEDPDCIGIKSGSLRTFYNFINSHNDLECPTLSLSPDYNIYASWRDRQKGMFSVHFLTNADVRFVIFKPNDRHPERKIRVSGAATNDILMETVEPYRIRDWISK